MLNKNEVYTKINHLPNELIPTLVAYIDFLLSQHVQKPTEKTTDFQLGRWLI